MAKQNTDYRNNMDSDTRSVDLAGEQAAENVNLSNDAAGEQLVSEENDAGQTIQHSVGKFGMLPDLAIDLGYTHRRHDFFERQAADNNKAVGGNGTSANRLLENYTADLNALPRAQMHFGTLAPLANMAARSFAKTDEVGKMTGHNVSTDLGLNKKEAGALRQATEANTGKQETGSINLAADKVKIARNAMIGESVAMAAVVRNKVIGELQAELSSVQGEKTEIAEKIERVTKIADYIEQAGTFVIGGSMIAKHFAPGGEHEEHSTASKAGEVGEGMEKGGSIAGKVVGFGMQLYYEEQVAALDRQLVTVRGQIGVHQAANVRDEFDTQSRRLTSAIDAYKSATEFYAAAIADRRATTAAIGRSADHIADKSGGDSNPSDAMLWMTTVKETQTHLGVGLDAGVDAQQNIDEVDAVVAPHRSTYSKDPAVRENHRGGPGPDALVLAQMQRLTKDWVQAATALKAEIDTHAASALDPTREHAGWTGQF